jgi:NIPSNAP
MIVEMRTYTLKPLRTAEFLSLYERMALPLQKKYLGNLIGFYVSEVGPLNEVVHLWGFDSMAERERRRAEMDRDPAWAAYRNAVRELDAISHQDTKLLKPTTFSPVQAVTAGA